MNSPFLIRFFLFVVVVVNISKIEIKKKPEELKKINHIPQSNLKLQIKLKKFLIYEMKERRKNENEEKRF